MNRHDVLERVLRHSALWEVQKRRVSGDPIKILREVYGANRDTVESIARNISHNGSGYRKVLKVLMEMFVAIGSITGHADTVSADALHRGLKSLRTTKPTHRRKSPLDLRPLILRPRDTERDERTLDEILETNFTGRAPNPVTDIAGF